MGLSHQVLNFNGKIREYEKFFVSNDNQEIESVTFAMKFGLPPWAYQTLPANNNIDQALTWFSEKLIRQGG
jgi:hypothetical protein